MKSLRPASEQVLEVLVVDDVTVHNDQTVSRTCIELRILYTEHVVYLTTCTFQQLVIAMRLGLYSCVSPGISTQIALKDSQERGIAARRNSILGLRSEQAMSGVEAGAAVAEFRYQMADEQHRMRNER